MADKASLAALGLGNEKLEGANFDDIPENLGQSFPDPPQPGTFRFKLPKIAVNLPMWAVVESKDYGKRINALFEDANELQVLQSPNKEHDGETFRWRLSNVPRERGKEKVLVSDMDLLLRALGVTKRPGTNSAYAAELVKLSEREFTATLELSWRCPPDKPIYVDDGAGGQAKVEDKNGCGARYYQRDISKVNGLYPIRITCSNPECGAILRAFPNLGGFKA